MAANKLKPNDKPRSRRLLDALVKRSSTDLIMNGAVPVVGVAFAEAGHRLAVADSGALRIWDTGSPTWLENLRKSACAAGPHGSQTPIKWAAGHCRARALNP